MKMLKKTKPGNMALSGAIFFFIIALILILFLGTSKRSMLTDARDSIATSMVASNLAVSCPDANALGSEGTTKLGNQSAYSIYTECLKKNMGLNDDMTPKENTEFVSTIKGAVTVSKIITYSVVDNDVTVTTYTPVGMTEQTMQNGVGIVTTPNGIKVSKSGVYSEITFSVKLIGNNESQKTMRQYTDVRVTN